MLVIQTASQIFKRTMLAIQMGNKKFRMDNGMHSNC